MISRREALIGGASLLAFTGIGTAGRATWAAGAPVSSGVPEGAAAEAELGTLAGKKPLIRLSHRPPNYETPVEYFKDVITPNDVFFVRYHHGHIPELTAAEWTCQIRGEGVEKPFTLSLASLKADFQSVEMVAVCQCSGNRRGLSKPHVPGVQWGYGAMGNAKWKGVRLKDVLTKAGLKGQTIEVAFNGADKAVMTGGPDFMKSLPVWKAMDENVLLVYEMNGAPLPHWNGFPVRLIVPGWTGTYWMKHLTTIEALTQPFNQFWMAPAYRIPQGKFPLVDRFISQETDAKTTPITEIVVNSLITSLTEGQKVTVGHPVEVKGIAWDAGYGIRTVEVSTDGGETWHRAVLGADLGRFSFKPWSHSFVPSKAGKHTVMVKATNPQGATQTFELVFNPAGYHNNVIETITIEAA
ncbi:MAG: molybdopterin-dependent oxidoreductase [Alphaproteobacteria bacterium]|nr:molybdopterin-dependent oxidoreductase [Alphaproteobacteria bacterium]